MNINKLIYYFLMLTLLLFASCQKKGINITPIASLNLVHAIVNQGAIEANFTDLSKRNTGNYQYYSQITTSVNYGNNSIYGALSIQNVPITVVATTDTAHPLFSGNLNLTRNGIYSLYLAGQSGAVDMLLVNDTLSFYSDSSCGIRFINLSLNSNPFIVTQASTPNTVEFNGLGYKQFSFFKKYTATASNSSYIFQVRDAVTNTVLSTYILSTPYFHNVTLAWIGQVGGTGVNIQKIIRINNY